MGTEYQQEALEALNRNSRPTLLCSPSDIGLELVLQLPFELVVELEKKRWLKASIRILVGLNPGSSYVMGHLVYYL